MEEWRLINWIPQLRGAYEVSSFGNVRRTAFYRHNHYTDTYQIIHKIRGLTPTDNGNGYKIVGMPIDTDTGIKNKNFYVHRLVATAFISNPERKPEINHKDHNRANNNASNLEWVTDKENTNYSAHLMCHPRSKSVTRGIAHRKNAFEVSVYHKNKYYYVGRFLTVEEAIKARDEKDKELGIV